ncbi:MAG: hypothetical protein H6Q28_1330 [Bacteroidetes bacterium]|nr:hypothetical protein [Bacteroidota bacterium]
MLQRRQCGPDGHGRSEGVDAEIVQEISLREPLQGLQVDRPDGIEQAVERTSRLIRRLLEEGGVGDVAGCDGSVDLAGDSVQPRRIPPHEVESVSARVECPGRRRPDRSGTTVHEDLAC